ncbi:hypothetical protein Ql52_gp048 [Caulobacter phage Quill_5.2]|uniref:Uncharacterized protein n=1 Tax=Caulobacter phage Quill_5.2 TaxID=3075108 RepID=A0AA96PWW7_9CAUD|nr:hypothetical protein Ql52_gp048 [Caulobacter phage Quill_5.2]
MSWIIRVATLSKGGGPPAGFAWIYDFEGNPLYDAVGVRIYGPI